MSKEYLKKYYDGSYVLMDGAGYSGQDNWIKIPDGADCLTSCNDVLIFWKGQDYSFDVEDDKDWVHCSDDGMKLDYYKDFYKDSGVCILWQREPSQTLNDKVASVDMAQQELKGVDATLAERESQYGSFSDVAELTCDLMGDLLRDDMSFVQREALHMICSKLARIRCGDIDKIDSWLDIAGYATLVVQDLEKKAVDADKINQSDNHDWVEEIESSKD